MASIKSFSSNHLRICDSPEAVSLANKGDPFEIIAARPSLSSILAIADCINSSWESPPAGNPAPQRPFNPFLLSSSTASSCPCFALSPFQGVPNGGFSRRKRILIPSKQSFFKVSACMKLSALCPLINISAKPIAYDGPIYSWPNNLISAVGL